MLINNDKQNIKASLFSSIIKHIRSFIIGLAITILIFFLLRYGFYSIINSMFEPTPLAMKFFDSGIFALVFYSIFIAGTVYVPTGHLGVLTVFGNRQAGHILTEGYTWLGPGFILGCEIESIRAIEIFIDDAQFSNDLIKMRFNVAYSYTVVNAINYYNNFKGLREDSLKSSLQESIRDNALTMQYLDSIRSDGQKLSSYLIRKANDKIKDIWGIEIQMVSVSNIRTDDPNLLSIYAKAELEIKETLLKLYKQNLELEFYVPKIESIMNKFKISLSTENILLLLHHLINQVHYYRFDVNMNEEMKNFFLNALSKTKEKFA